MGDSKMMGYLHMRDCPKCGGHPGTYYDAVMDLIKRVCGRCGYTWKELPRDRHD